MGKLILQNAASIYSNLGGRNVGYIALVVTPAKYLLTSGGVAFTDHLNPPMLPPIPNRATQLQIASIRVHTKKKRDYIYNMK